MEDKMKFLLEERFALFNKLCTTYYESSFFNKERENIFKEGKKELENFVTNKETISKMEQLINDYKDDIIMLYDYGYSEWEIEEMLYSPMELQEFLSELRLMEMC